MEHWEGDPVRVANERGEMITTVTLRDRLPEGLVTFPEHFDEQARVLMPLTIDDKEAVLQSGPLLARSSASGDRSHLK